MNQQQQQARERAARTLTQFFQRLSEKTGEPLSAEDRVAIDSIIDNLIIAITPGPSEHADAVEQLKRETKIGTVGARPDPRD